jgi:hypothetical protein
MCNMSCYTCFTSYKNVGSCHSDMSCKNYEQWLQYKTVVNLFQMTMFQRRCSNINPVKHSDTCMHYLFLTFNCAFYPQSAFMGFI